MGTLHDVATIDGIKVQDISRRLHDGAILVQNRGRLWFWSFVLPFFALVVGLMALTIGFAPTSYGDPVFQTAALTGGILLLLALVGFAFRPPNPVIFLADPRDRTLRRRRRYGPFGGETVWQAKDLAGITLACQPYSRKSRHGFALFAVTRGGQTIDLTGFLIEGERKALIDLGRQVAGALGVGSRFPKEKIFHLEVRWVPSGGVTGEGGGEGTVDGDLQIGFRPDTWADAFLRNWWVIPALLLWVALR